MKLASGLKFDLTANFAGVGWSVLMQIACLPFYLKFLGIEAYGLMGFHLMLQSIFQVLDFGLSPTMNREMARYSVQPEKGGESRDLVRTLEAAYWLIGIAMGAVLVVGSSVIAKHWIKASAVPLYDVQRAVMLMGGLTVFQWPASFYLGGLMGLGRQVQCNGINVLFSTLSNGGALVILWLISPTIQAFFLWLIAVNAAKAIFLATFLWKSLPPAVRPALFDLDRVRSIKQFAMGMSGITLCGLILTQSDKFIVSKLFSLKVFGYYSIAGMLGTGLSMIVASVFNTIFPRFSALAAAGNEEALRHLYHRCTQLMAVLILPLAAVSALFSTEILQLWTRNAEVARNAGPIAAFLVMGSALNGLTNLPYALQLAHGWTSIGLSIATLLTIVFVPAIWLMATFYGPIGVASVWFMLNAIYMVIDVLLTHSRLLKGEAWRWFAEVGLPLIVVSLVALIGREFVEASTTTPRTVCVLLVEFFCAAGAATLVSPSIRPRIISQVLRAKTAC